MDSSYIESVKKQFLYYKSLGDKTFEQLKDNDIHWQYSDENNSVAIIVKHIVGNMLSRWTNFLTEDGEKEWRNRDEEFLDTYENKKEMLAAWEKGWKCLFSAINTLKAEDIERIIYIRNQGHTVVEAINRQSCHYSYHVGQLVYVAKMIKNEDWNNLSIERNKSISYNQNKFTKNKTRKHFTDDL